MKFDPTGRDRRRFQRTSLSTEIFYRVVGAPEGEAPQAEKENMAYLFNVSEGGLGFMCGSQVPAGASLEVAFNFLLDGCRNLKITAVGLVRYCFLMGDYKRYQVGIEFTSINDADKKFIADYVRSMPGDKE